MVSIIHSLAHDVLSGLIASAVAEHDFPQLKDMYDVPSDVTQLMGALMAR